MWKVVSYDFRKENEMDFCFFRFSEYDEDEDYKKWLQKWKRIEDKDEKLGHIQKFFRMLLSDESTMRYYSFCNEDLAEEGWTGIVRFVKHVVIGENGIVMDATNVRSLTMIFVRIDLKEEFVLGAYGTTFPCPRCERKERMFSFW